MKHIPKPDVGCRWLKGAVNIMVLKMKFCEFCNKSYPDNASFCASCGNRLVIILKCPYCFTDLDIEFNHCPQCGKSLQQPFASNSISHREFIPTSSIQQERYNCFKSAFEQLITQGHGGFVVFEEQRTGMFVQYAQDGKSLRVDHPKPCISTIFTQEHEDRMRFLLEQEFLKVIDCEDSLAADVGTDIDYLIYLTDSIFKHVFGFDASYEVIAEISFDGEYTNILGN